MSTASGPVGPGPRTQADGDGGAEADDVGSLREEATRLWSVLADRAGHHDGAGSDGCACPVCRGLALVQGVSPQTWAQVSSAARSLAHAAEGLMRTPVPGEDRVAARTHTDERAGEGRSWV